MLHGLGCRMQSSRLSGSPGPAFASTYVAGLAFVATMSLPAAGMGFQQKPADYPITPVPLTAVSVNDAFWAPKTAINRTVSIPHIIKQNELTGRIANFLKAAHKVEGAYQGQRYN